MKDGQFVEDYGILCLENGKQKNMREIPFPRDVFDAIEIKKTIQTWDQKFESNQNSNQINLTAIKKTIKFLGKFLSRTAGVMGRKGGGKSRRIRKRKMKRRGTQEGGRRDGEHCMHASAVWGLFE